MRDEPDNGALAGFLHSLAAGHADRDTVFGLRLAETGARTLATPPPLPSVAVIGPTQTGKSSVVNVIAGGHYVETSPLAAHTRRASLLAVNAADEAQVSAYAGACAMGDFSVTPRAVHADGPPRLIWDTPDFDSNVADVYREQVARVCALADLVVMVVSREKYADQSVWRVLESLAPLGTPTIICLNKCDEDTGTLVSAIGRRLGEMPPPVSGIIVTTLPRVAGGEPDRALARPEVRDFRAGVFEHLAPLGAGHRRAGLHRLLTANWAAWTEPVEQELACRDEWSGLLAARSGAFLSRYRAEYIQHARHHDVARKAILGLLELLEIPALAGPMTRTRHVLTWPFRKMGGIISRRDKVPRDPEQQVLDAAFEHYLLALRGETLERRHPWWRAAAIELGEREEPLRRSFQRAVGDYRQAFQPRIDALSEELYQRLRQNPLTLNALRATRVSADAGGIVLAIKTGTLGVYDALFAPAVISLTSFLTESAVGGYLRTVIARLKRDQVELVQRIVRDELEQPLRDMRPGGPELFDITRAELEEARRRMEALDA